MILIGFILLSLSLSVINVRIVRLDKDIIYANLAGCIMPLAAASYFGALLITKLNLLVVIGSLAIASFVQIKRTKVFSGGSGGIILFITIAAVTLAIIAPFSPSPGDKLILLRLFFVYMLAVCATIISDLFQINKRRKDPRPCVSLVGGNGIFDGIWIGGYMTAMVLLILHYDGYLDLGQQFFTWRGF